MPECLPPAGITMAPPDLITALAWQETGRVKFEAVLGGLGQDELTSASLLPGWSRAHVIGHVARNADALLNLLSWASTGIERPMYADADARQRDIEAAASQPAPQLRADLLAASERYSAATDGMSRAAWDSHVRTAQGRRIRAAEVPWLRARELWVHAVDLRAGLRFEDLPADILVALLDDATATLTARKTAGLQLTDPAGQTWTIPGNDPLVLHGNPAALAAYLLRGLREGRLGSPGRRRIPDPPRWL